MSIDFKLPELGENIESADVISVLVKPGDSVKKEQGVIEIETDKATIEVPSSIEGKIKDILVKEGDKVKVGQTIITVDTNGQEPKKTGEAKKPANKSEEKKSKTGADPVENKKEEKQKTAKEIVDVKLPELGENIESADVINVLVNKGDNIEKEQGIIEIETDKATIEVPSPVIGKVTDVLIKTGEKAKVGQILIKVSAEELEEVQAVQAQIPETHVEEKEVVEEKPAETKTQGEKEITDFSEKPETQPPINRGAAPAAPSVRRIARELGVDINKVPGSGPSGRISMEDVKDYVKKLNVERESGFGTGIKAETLPDFSKWGEVERKNMSNVRAKTAQHLSYAWAYTPHVTQFDKADITDLEGIRKDLNHKVEKEGGKLTVTAILIKILTSAIKVFPQFNSSIDMEKKQVIFKKYFNIGIAVDTDHGLIVPVIKNTDRKNLIQLSIEMNELAEKARNRKISLEEMQGGCITITNLGGIGGTYFSPIVNSPEVAILGISRSSLEPVYKDGGFKPRLMLPLSLSYDHRIIDGADAVRFLRWVCEALEQPVKLILEG